MDWHGTAQYMAAHGLPLVPLLLTGAIVVEVILGACLAIGYKSGAAALILALYLIPTTYFFHAFWNNPGDQMVMIEFLKNLAIFGGLLYVASKELCHCPKRV